MATAQDIRFEVEARVAAEVSNQAFGEAFGWAVTWGPAPVQTPQGTVLVPLWQLVLTCRNPLPGGGELFHMAQLGMPRPKEADVRREVASGIAQLRDLAKSKLSGSNGHAKQPVPG